MSKNEMTWVIGGAQGSGVDSSANIFGRACGFGGLHVFGKREYYSNIMGEHSYFNIRVSERPVRSHFDAINLLATFDAETLFRHAQDVTANGAIVYDPGQVKVKLADIPTIEARVKQDLRAYLMARGLGETVQDVLDAVAKRGVQVRPIPMADFLEDVQKKFDVDQPSKLSRMVNVFAVAASFGLLRYDFGLVARAIQHQFRTKAKVAEMNAYGAQLAYDHVRERFAKGFSHRLAPVPVEEARIYVNGSQAVGLGKMLSGCRLQTYYPITPASDESEYLEANAILPASLQDEPEAQEAGFLKENGNSVVVVQTEDEIAAITMANGAALTGARSSTATSGPGFCLMMEGIGWASINELPVVVTLYQRAGPSTGMPTRHEQGDLRFAIHAGHGASPRIVFASADLEECFYDTMKAFNFAERYQMPVIHIVDKALANSNQTVPRFTADGVTIDRGVLARPADDGEFKRFQFTQNGISPRAVFGMPGTVFWNTGDEHDESGHITEDPVLRILMMEKRMGKLDLALREIPEEDQLVYHGDPKADTVVVGWGSTKGAILDATDILRKEGYKIGFLQFRLLHPFPAERAAKILKGRKKIVDVEMNYDAALAGLIREHTGIAVTHKIVKFQGRPMSCNELRDGLKSVLEGRARERQVLRRGA
jgi:2-oxoglutarate ferredoxin oxidoreductase subunit alpha